MSSTQVFDSWTGNVAPLGNLTKEWHAWFIMPATNVALTSTVKSITPFTLQLQQIRGRDRLKPVYYYFPAGHKGFVYLLHGTGGRAVNVVNSYEFQQLAKVLVSDGLGVVVTESEETTTGVDANGDGKLRWSLSPADTLNNVDYVNIRVITDTLYNRGLTDRSKLRYSIGMSNGGAFSAALSATYRFKAAVSYCAPAGAVVAQLSQVPLQFCMARNDNNENVGAAGNADALTNSNTLMGRGICSKYFMQERSPVYPERFARSGDITIAQSQAVFNELKTKGYINSRNCVAGFSDALLTAYQASPTSFPQLNSLTLLQRLFVIEQLDLCVADHQMFSDFNTLTLKFLNTQCL